MARSKTPHEYPVLLAIIGAPHGIKGEMRIKSFTQTLLGFADYAPLFDASGRHYELLTVRPAKNVAIVRIKGIDHRNQAEKLKGTELFTERSQLQAPKENEFYIADLVGAETILGNGEIFGQISAVHNFGAGDIVEIRLESGKTELFAFTREAFPMIDLENKKVVFCPPDEVSERDKITNQTAANRREKKK